MHSGKGTSHCGRQHLEAGLKHDDLPTHLDLFSGIGGFALAAQRCGFRTVGFCERSEKCRAWLANLFPGVPQITDVRNLDGRLYRGVTLLTGGFPCQPWSRAGKRRGTDDDRALWPEMRRVIQEARPHWIIGENVPGIIELALDGLLSDLEADGYEGGAFVVPACAVGSPTLRERVFLVYADRERWQGPIGIGLHSEKAHEGKERVKPVRSDVPSWPPRPDAISEIPPFADGFSDPLARSKREAIGNAIVPQIAEIFMREIFCLLNSDS